MHAVATRDDRDRKMDEIAATLSEQGEKVYKIPLGASNEIGSFGMAAAVEEIGVQQLELGEQFDRPLLAHGRPDDASMMNAHRAGLIGGS